MRKCIVGNYGVGDGEPLLVIAGPCVLENEGLAMEIAEELKRLSLGLKFNLVFKGSFDKANRSRIDSFRGVGLSDGLQILKNIRDEFQLPVTTDIHEINQAVPVSQVCDLIQIPAFLSRQTDLLIAAAKTCKAVNVKKGQFMSPQDMSFVVTKLQESGCNNILLCERGTFFGYGQLVNDMRALVHMKKLEVPVVFDATHSVQSSNSSQGVTGGDRDMIIPLASAASAVGIDALFFETHPNPDQSPSDAGSILDLKKARELLEKVISIREVLAN